MQFYTLAEVAIILETKVGLMHEWIQEGLLPAVQFGSEQHMLQICYPTFRLKVVGNR